VEIRIVSPFVLDGFGGACGVFPFQDRFP
jgi:hypothetical protein